MKQKSITANFVFNLAKTSSSFLFPIITFAYASRVLTVEGLGEVNFARSIITYFTMIASLGITNYGTREGAKLRDHKDRLSKFAQEMLFINLLSTVLACLLLGVAILLIPRLWLHKDLLLVFGSSVILTGLSMEWLYSALEEYRYITIRSMIFQIISVILMFLFVKDSSDCVPYAVISVVATTSSYILNFWNCKKHIEFRRYSSYQIKKHIRPITLLFAFVVSVNLYTALDITMLGFISGNRTVGLYTVGEKVSKLVITLITSLGVVLMPRLSYYLEAGLKQEFGNLVIKAYQFVFLFSIPACFGLFVLSREIICVFSGKGYEEAVLTMRILTPIVLVIPFSVLTNNQILIPMRKEKLILVSTCTGAAVNLILNSILIPQLAQNGAAIGTVLAEASVMCICYHNASRHFKMRVIFKEYWKYWLAAVPILPIGWAVKQIVVGNAAVIMFTTGIGGGIYFWVLFILKCNYFFELLRLIINKIEWRTL